ncbi:MAG: protein kinase [Deltaproteobacteria bacterium]|nr:protein kinase [Deltaproteobacteria bacterium]
MSSSATEARVLGDFVLGAKLGEGGFGTVYKAHQNSLDRPAVIKTVRASLAHRQEAHARFLQEAKLASRFDHPYAAHVYAFGAEPDGLLWIAMELVRGTPLDQLLASSGPLPIERFLPLMERLCDVVQAAHEQGIVHRDIKPSNVMVIARAGRLLPKLLDFGIAKAVKPDIKAKPLQARAKRASQGGPVSEATPAELDHTMPAASGEDTAPASSSGELTQAGQVLGSPLYMAPEQWLDATTVGPWTDQYALGILAFELLTGKRPFDARSMHELAAQHVYDPLPALPTTLPAALHAALSKATAKDPAQRHADLGAMAAALREACALPAEIEERVEQPGELFAAWSADAPRPLAEAVAAVAAARSPVRVADRAQDAAQVLAHWLGIVALAARSRLGTLRAGDDASLIRELRRRALRDTEWLDLAAAITAPYRERAETFPVPELVELFAGEGVVPLRALLDSNAGLLVVDAATSVEMQTARARISQLAKTLEACSWLLDYELARGTTTGLELWMGQPSDELVTRAGTEEAGRIMLLDADGVRVASLSPLVAIAAPTPGQREHVFALGGPGRTLATARLAALPAGFEHDAEGVWSWLAEHVLEIGPAADDVADDDRPPYPGLAPFTAKDAGSYVGREREIEELVNRLRRDAIVAVVGPSGAGKSSFLAAGVIPALPAGWQAEMLRPGDDPLAALAEIAHATDGSPYRASSMRAGSGTTPEQIASALKDRAEHATLVIAIDQGEELFTMCRDDARRQAFAGALLQAARAANVKVVVGVRDDFFVRVDELAAWQGMLARAVQILRPPGAAELERIVREPVKRRGYDFEDPTLAAKIAEELAGRAGALSLVAFAGAELWERRDRHFHRIPTSAYTDIGGVQGALVRHADGVVDGLPAEDRRLVRLAFRRLLAADGTRVLVEKADLIAALGNDAAATRVIERLLASRLIVTRDDDTGSARVEIVHEALTTTWPRLAEWRREGDADLRLHQQLTAAAKAWDDRARPHGLLWAGDALAELRTWRQRTELRMTPTEQAFADASVRAHTRGRRRRFAALAGALGTLTTGVVLLAGMNRVVSHQKAETVERLAASMQEHGRIAIEADDPGRALVYFNAAKKLGANNAALDFLVARAAQAIESERALLIKSDHPMNQVRFDAATLVANGPDSIAQAWDRSSHARLGQPMPAIADAAILGNTIAWYGLSTELTVTDRDGLVRWKVPALPGQVDALRRLRVEIGPTAIAAGYRTVRLFDPATGTLQCEISTGAPIELMAFDATGSRLAIGDDAGTVTVWDVATRTRLTTCPAHGAKVTALVLSSDGTRLFSGGDDRTVLVCDVEHGQLLHRLEGHANSISHLDVSPQGDRLVSASLDGTARVWDLKTGSSMAVLARHRGTVTEAQFSPDGSLIATSGSDGTVRIWDPDSGSHLGLVQGAGAMTTVTWEPGGRVLWTTSSDGTAREWDVAAAVRGSTWRQDASQDLAVVSNVEVSAGEGPSIVWDLAHARALARIPVSSAMSAQLRGDGQRALVVDASGHAAAWSIDGAMVHALPIDNAITAGFAGSIEAVANDHAITLWDDSGRPIATSELGFMTREIDTSDDTIFAISLPRGAEEPAIGVLDRAGHVTAKVAGGALTIDRAHHRLATCVGPRIRIYDTSSWRATRDFVGHAGSCTTVAYLADGRLISGGNDRTIRLWSANGEALRTVTLGSTPFSIVTSHDGALVAAGGHGGMIEVVDTAALHVLETASVASSNTWKLATAPDDSVLTATVDGHVARWSLSHAPRSSADLDRLTRCRVPMQLEGDDVVPRRIDFDDPTCRR